MSPSSLHTLNAVAEVTYGVTPATPAFNVIRHNGATLALAQTAHKSEELRADRQIADFQMGQKQTGGDISFELSYGSFDAFLEAALCGDWTSNVLKGGTVRKSFSILRKLGAVADNDKPYQLFTGCEVSKMALTIPTDGRVTGSFSILGKDLSVATAAPTGSTFVAANTKPFMQAKAGKIYEGGALVGYFTEANFTVENGLSPRNAIGDAGTAIENASIGTQNVTGQVTAYFKNATLLEKFLNGTQSTLKYELPDSAGNKYEILFPKILYTGGQTDTNGQSGDIMIPLPFQAILDSTAATSIQITRTPIA
jgi:hypothetical protein